MSSKAALSCFRGSVMAKWAKTLLRHTLISVSSGIESTYLSQ